MRNISPFFEIKNPSKKEYLLSVLLVLSSIGLLSFILTGCGNWYHTVCDKDAQLNDSHECPCKMDPPDQDQDPMFT